MSVNPENTGRMQDGRFRAGVSGNPTRENSVVRLGIDGLEKLAGRRCAAWVKSQEDRDKIGLVETRNYIPVKTAFYATWWCLRNRPHPRSSWKRFLTSV